MAIGIVVRLRGAIGRVQIIINFDICDIFIIFANKNTQYGENFNL